MFAKAQAHNDTETRIQLLYKWDISLISLMVHKASYNYNNKMHLNLDVAGHYNTNSFFKVLCRTATTEKYTTKPLDVHLRLKTADAPTTIKQEQVEFEYQKLKPSFCIWLFVQIAALGKLESHVSDLKSTG